MVATARRLAPALTWEQADLATLALDRTFDVVVMAGNVLLFTPEGTQSAVVAGCRRHLADGGALVAGFQLGRGVTLEGYDEDCRTVGLALAGRWATWSGEPFDDGSTYAVSLHRPAD
jgi:hypothetical protein